jgi:hypothetical protein
MFVTFLIIIASGHPYVVLLVIGIKVITHTTALRILHGRITQSTRAY